MPCGTCAWWAQLGAFNACHCRVNVHAAGIYLRCAVRLNGCSIQACGVALPCVTCTISLCFAQQLFGAQYSAARPPTSNAQQCAVRVCVIGGGHGNDFQLSAPRRQRCRCGGWGMLLRGPCRPAMPVFSPLDLVKLTAPRMYRLARYTALQKLSWHVLFRAAGMAYFAGCAVVTYAVASCARGRLSLWLCGGRRLSLCLCACSYRVFRQGGAGCCGRMAVCSCVLRRLFVAEGLCSLVVYGRRSVNVLSFCVYLRLCLRMCIACACACL